MDKCDPAFGVLTCLTPDWAVSPNVTAFCTTRLGGVSEAPYDSLNLGLHVGDEDTAVQENRRLLADAFALPAAPHWLKQTHSTDIASIDKRADGTDYWIRSADGAWTEQPDTVLAVLTADCLPVVISDVRGTQLAVVHAGWRGLAGGILANALARFDPQVELHAWLGPAIGPDAFEVGEDVHGAFTTRNAHHAACFKPGKSNGKFWADLYALAHAELQQCRSISVTGGQYCTLTQSHWFHSHRRDGVRSGRMATVAWLGRGSSY